MGHPSAGLKRYYLEGSPIRRSLFAVGSSPDFRSQKRRAKSEKRLGTNVSYDCPNYFAHASISKLLNFNHF
jgi:hypothetical protein